jgi:hypothetical protein
MNDMRMIRISIPNDVRYKFTNKVKFYDLTAHDVIFTLIQMFNDGEFDEVFNIPKEDVDE